MPRKKIVTLLPGHTPIEPIAATTLDTPSAKDAIEVNGEIYLPRPQHNKPNDVAATLAAYFEAAGLLEESKYQRPLPNVNLPEEYGRIQRKESKLGRWERDQVEAAFNQLYIKVPLVEEGEI